MPASRPGGRSVLGANRRGMAIVGGGCAGCRRGDPAALAMSASVSNPYYYGTGEQYAVNLVLHGRVLRGTRRDNGKRRFACRPGPSHSGCGRIEVNADPVEALVSETLFAVVDTPVLADRRKRQVRQRRHRDDAAALEEELAELAAMRGAGELTTAEWRAARAALVARLEVARMAQVGAQRALVISPASGALPVRAALAAAC